MNKFSLYDFMGMLLPGFVFTWLLNALLVLFGVKYYTPLDISLSGNLGLALCLSVALGSLLYAFNFWLINRKWYNYITGIYKPLFLLANALPFNAANKKVINQYQKQKGYKKLFITTDKYNSLSPKQKKKLANRHNTFYNQMYYELEYLGKLEYPKTFQSFYFFFRQLFSACWMVLIFFLTLWALSFVPCSFLGSICLHTAIKWVWLLMAGMTLSLALARWYRKRMVLKMYLCFYTHINQTLNQ